MPVVPKDMSNAAIARRAELSNELKLAEAKRIAPSAKAARGRKRKSAGDNEVGSSQVHQA